MSVNASHANSSGERAPNPDDDVAWLARLNDVFARWASWAAESNARSSACFRQMFADRWIELTLAERVLEDVRTASAESRASRARQARAWTLRCIERMTTSVTQSRGVEDWMHDGLRFQAANRGTDDGTPV